MSLLEKLQIRSLIDFCVQKHSCMLQNGFWFGETKYYMYFYFTKNIYIQSLADFILKILKLWGNIYFLLFTSFWGHKNTKLSYFGTYGISILRNLCTWKYNNSGKWQFTFSLGNFTIFLCLLLQKKVIIKLSLLRQRHWKISLLSYTYLYFLCCIKKLLISNTTAICINFLHIYN